MIGKEIDALFIKRKENYKAERAVMVAEWNELCRRMKAQRLAYEQANKSLADTLYKPTEKTPDKIAKQYGFKIQRAVDAIADKLADKFPELIDRQGVKNTFDATADGIRFDIIIPFKTK